MDDYAEQAVINFVADITGHLFLSIQRDKDLLREYKIMAKKYTDDKINKAIGRKVKELLKLRNAGVNTSPKSRLITKYTLHKLQPQR